ncbi:MAG: hypothetical protein WAO16_18870 [Pseudolabrys sp.]|jgi:hypothetical protein
MKLYAVRYIEDKAMVGLFYVRRLADIVVQIDAETDPRECECKPISECGAILFGEPDEEGPDHLRWYERLHFCDRFDRAFRDCETETKGWTPVCPGEIPSMTSGTRALKGEATPTTAE